MRKSIYLLFIITSLLFLPLVSAQMIGQVNDSIPLYVFHTKNGLLEDATNASMTIGDSLGNLLVSNQLMTRISTGVYVYNYTFNLTGQYWFVGQTNHLGHNNESYSEIIRIVTNINNIAQDTSDVVQTIFATFIVFLVGLLIAVLARYLKEPSFYYFSSVYFIGSSAYMYFDGQGWSFPMFFALFGLLVAYKGISEHIFLWEAKQKEKDRNEFDEIE